jgi:RNase P/RNase MRP subunit p30
VGEEIKSAMEIAMEKVDKLGEVTEQERLKWKYVPEGEKLAARYLKQNLNLLAELSQYEESARKYIIEGAQEILARNINLPRNDAARRNNKRAMDGLKILKNDKASVENVYSRIRRIFEHYGEPGESQRKQAYESLKADVEARIQQAVKQQLGTFAGIKIDVESQPQFQEEWRKLQTQLDLQYIKLLDEYKQELSAIR